MKRQRYYWYECVLIELCDANKKKVKMHTLLPSILKHLFDLSSLEMSKVPLSFDLGNKPPNCPKKHWMILLFGAVNLSKFSLWLVVGSLFTIAAFFCFLCQKYHWIELFLYLKVLLSAVFELLDIEELPLTLQWLWNRGGITPVSTPL